MINLLLRAVGVLIRLFISAVRNLSEENANAHLIKSLWFPVLSGLGAIIYNWHESYHQVLQMLLWAAAAMLLQTLLQQIRALIWKPSTNFGSARFARGREIQKIGLLDRHGLILGRRKGQVLRYGGPGHLLTFAPTRSGKGAGGVIPNLLDHKGSAFVIDMKGENFAITGRYRKTVGRVVTIAPFSDDVPCGGFNPLDFIRRGTAHEVADASLLADLIVSPVDQDTYFDQEARLLISALILYVNQAYPDVCRNLGEVSDLLHKDELQFEEHVGDMLSSGSKAVQQRMAAFSQKEPKEKSHVLSTAQSHMAVWSSEHPLHAVTKHSDFRFEDLKAAPVTVYVIVPPEYMHFYRAFLRVMTGVAVASMSRSIKKADQRVIFFLDEVAALGEMPVIENAIGYLAGYGVQLWLFFQDLDQLRQIYKKWRSILANCAVKQAFNVADVQTANEVSAMLGTKTVHFTSHSRSLMPVIGLPSLESQSSEQQASRAVLTPDEVVNMPVRNQLLFVQGCRPVLAQKLRYFDWSEWRFWGKWDRP